MDIDGFHPLFSTQFHQAWHRLHVDMRHAHELIFLIHLCAPADYARMSGLRAGCGSQHGRVLATRLGSFVHAARFLKRVMKGKT
jgi:hypothetical protein